MEQGPGNRPDLNCNSNELDWLEFWPEDREFAIDHNTEAVLVSGQIPEANLSLKSDHNHLSMHSATDQSSPSMGMLDDLNSMNPLRMGQALEAFQVKDGWLAAFVQSSG